jgi:hypothetical protein
MLCSCAFKGGRVMAKAYKNIHTGEVIYINDTEELEDYRGLINPDDFEEEE